MRVVVGVPSQSTVQSETAVHLAAMGMHSVKEGIEVMCANYQAARIERCRNFLADAAIRAEADYLLMIDSDMIFPKDSLVRLMEHEKPVVGALYRKRNPDENIQSTTAVDFNREYIRGGEKGLVQAYMIGMGLVLIDTKVFNDISKPYFQALPKQDGDFLGEDFIFSKKTNEAGHSVWLDMDLSKEVRHIGKRYIDLDVPEQPA